MKNSLLIAFVAVGAISQAQVIYLADFNAPDYTVGDVDGQLGWSAPQGNEFVSADGNNSTQGLEFSMPQPGVFSNASQGFSGGFSGPLSGSVDIKVGADYVPSGSSRNLRTGFGFTVGNGSTSSEISYYLDTVTNGNNVRFDLLSLYIDGGLIGQEIVTFRRDEWVTLSVDYNPTSGLTKFFYNGGFVDEDTAISGGNVLSTIYGQLSNGDTSLVSGVKVQHDNYRFEAVPEPATMAVLAGLGALALRRRKK